jgi:hypothetical protein
MVLRINDDLTYFPKPEFLKVEAATHQGVVKLSWGEGLIV